MSIGPEAKTQDSNIAVSAQVGYITKKTISAFFEAPARYIWYIAILSTFIGLYIGKTFSWQYWLLLVFIGGFNAYIYFAEKHYEEIIKE